MPGVRPARRSKPFIYGMALDQGLIHPQTLLPDSPRSFGGYDPENFDRVFRGPCPLMRLCAPAVTCPRFCWPRSCARFLWLSAARRGGSPVQRGPLRPQPRARRRGGFHARELGGLYAMLANKGVWRHLRLYEGEAAGSAVPLLSPEAAVA